MNRSPRLSSQGRVRWQGRRRRRALGLLPGLCAVLLAAGPARAVETIRLRLTLVPELFTVKVAELRSPDALLAGNSDLAELDRASDGEIGRRLARAMGSPLPLRLRDVLTNALGSPLLEQVLAPLLSDFEASFARGLELVDHCPDQVMAAEARNRFRQRLQQAQAGLVAARALRAATPAPMALDMATITPWHELVVEVWSLSAALRAAGVHPDQPPQA